MSGNNNDDTDTLDNMLTELEKKYEYININLKNLISNPEIINVDEEYNYKKAIAEAERRKELFQRIFKLAQAEVQQRKIIERELAQKK